MITVAFRPIKNECVVVMRGDKVAGTIKRYRQWKCCIVHIAGVMDASAPQGSRVFPTITEAKKAVLATFKEYENPYI